MTRRDPLEQLRRRAYRHALENGATDIVLGIYTLIVGVATQRRGLLALAVVYLAVLAPACRFLSDRLSRQRTGYAEVPGDPPRQLLAGSLAAGALTLLVVGALTFSAGRLWSLAHWPVWSPVLAGLILAGGWLHTAWRSGLRRFVGYGAAAVGGSLFFWLFPFGPRINPSDRLTLLLFALAALLIVTGSVVAARFVRRQPVLSVEGRHE